MNAIDILGSLLGQKASGSGSGADILRDILTGGARETQPPAKAQPPKGPAPTSRPSRAEEIDANARELEDLLNVANRGEAQRTTKPPQQQIPTPPSQPSRQFPDLAPREAGSRPGGDVSRRYDSPASDAERQNAKALVLVQAMVNAAKCDGQISQAEQQSILSRLDNPSPATIQFLRDEFAKPLDVREFAWSVPLGMEQQVYSMSLIAIDVDTQQEDTYLRELAQGLRLAPETCEQIKERMGGSSGRLAGVR